MHLLARRLPELAAGLPPGLPEGEVAFDARVKQRFPPGTPEDDLKAELRRQGFRLLPEYRGVHDGTLYRGWIVKTLWSVRRKSRHGRVPDSWGVFGFKAP
jgi:hypothetical protein